MIPTPAIEEQTMLDLERFDTFMREGRIIRSAWTGTDAKGRETACLLAALSADVAKKESPEACPASDMWPWLAHLTPWIDDAGSADKWPGVIQRYGEIARKLHRLDDAAGRRLNYTMRKIALDEAARHFDHDKFPNVAKAIATVNQLLVRAIKNDVAPEQDWAAARAAAAAARAAAAAARAAAAGAAGAVAAGAAGAAAAAGVAGAAGAAWVAGAAEAAAAAAQAARAAEAAWAAVAEAEAEWAAAASADRMIDAILTAIEDEIRAVET